VSPSLWIKGGLCVNAGFLIGIWLLANVAAVGVYDVAIFAFGNPEDSVSVWVQRWMESFPVLAVGLGILIGHLAWPIKRDH
jgi:hypothetical protein